MLARWLGPENFGLYSIGLSVFNILTVLAVMGLDNAALRFIPIAAVSGNVIVIAPTVRTLLVFGAITSGIVTATLYATKEWLAHVFSDKDLVIVFGFFALAIPLYVCGVILLSVLQSLHDVRWRMNVKYVAEPIVRMALAAALILSGWQLIGALSGFLMSVLASCSLASLIVYRRLKTIRTEERDRRGTPTLRSIGTYVLPLLIGLVFATIATRSDVLILGHHLSATQAGVYAAALQTSGIIIIILQSVESIAVPLLSEALASGVRARVSEIYALTLRWSLTFGLPVCIVFFLFAEETLGFFGTPFRGAALAFSVLVTAQLVNLATGSANYVLLLSGRSRVVMGNQIVGSVLQVGLNVILIYQYGILGAALAMFAAIATINIARLFQVYWLLDLQPFRWVLLKPIFAALVVLFLFGWAKGQFDGIAQAALVPAIFGTYFFLILAMGLDSQDVRLLRSFGQRAKLP